MLILFPGRKSEYTYGGPGGTLSKVTSYVKDTSTATAQWVKTSETSYETKEGSSQTRVVPFGDRFGEPSLHTVA